MKIFNHFKKSKLVHLVIAITFSTSGIIINIIQLLLHICLRPFNLQLHRYLMNYLCFSLFSQLVFICEWWSNSRIEVWMDKEVKQFAGKENALLIMNHSYDIDLFVFLMFSDKYQLLGKCKIFVKKALLYLPFIGLAFKFADFIFLERSLAKDSKTITRQLQTIMSSLNPILLFICPEGTRFTPQKHEASVEFAKKHGLPILKHHLNPRTGAFTASLPSLRNKFTIYDINLAFKKEDPVKPKFRNMLNGNGVKAYMYIRRIPIDKVPEDEGKAAQWLQEMFCEKDRIQDSFHTTGSFFKTSGFKETQSEVHQPQLPVLINIIAWAMFSMSIIFYCLLTPLLSQNWIGLSIALGIPIISSVLASKAIDFSEPVKEFSCGKKEPK